MAPNDPSVQCTLDTNEQILRNALGDQRGITFRKLTLDAADGKGRTALLVYAEAEIDQMRMDTFLVRPLLQGDSPALVGGSMAPGRVGVQKLSDAVGRVMRGSVLYQIEGSTQLFAVSLMKMPHRPIEAPDTEVGVNGPREAFSEYLPVNLTQIRRRLPGKFLKIEPIWIGTEAKIESVLLYLDGKPTQRMIETLRQRLGAITQDGVQGVSELTEAVADTPISLFPSVLITERPDIVAHYLMSGRIAVMLENGSRALIMPAIANDFFTSADDWYEWRPFVFFLRLLRYGAFIVAVPLPALYVSVTTYHLQALPTQLTLSLLGQREGAPLPPPVEAVIMTMIFEILREAGIRLPHSIGPTVSIVGGLVIGEAAIRSGITSPSMVLVVSATAVATFALPSTTLANAATFCRFGLLFLASTFGFFGLLMGYLVILANVAGTTSLGVPYGTPLMPLRAKFLKVSMGLNPRPPRSTGAMAPPAKTSQAEDYEEGN